MQNQKGQSVSVVEFNLDKVLPASGGHRHRMLDARVERDEDGRRWVRVEFAVGWGQPSASVQQDHLAQVEVIDQNEAFSHSGYVEDMVRKLARDAKPCRCQHCDSARRIMGMGSWDGPAFR